MHFDTPHVLLSNEVSDFDLEEFRLAILLDVDVDGKVGVDVAHLVLESLGDANHHVFNNGTDGAEGCDTLSGSVVHFNGDEVLLGSAEAYRNV